jgi:AcrR family transcriptional regulator
VVSKSDRSPATRTALLAAARRVFAAKGYRDSNVADIVSAAGRGRGTFYLHFENKQAVFGALLDVVAEQMGTQARLIWRNDQPVRSVRASVERFLEEFDASRDLWRLFDEVTATDREFAELRERWRRTFSTRVLHGIEGTPTEALELLDAPVIADLLAGMLDEVGRILFVEAQPRDRGKLTDHITSLWAHALGYPVDEIASPLTDDRQRG